MVILLSSFDDETIGRRQETVAVGTPESWREKREVSRNAPQCRRAIFKGGSIIPT